MAGQRRQKPKGRKRPREWHRGQGEADRWDATPLPDVASGADPTTGEPMPVHLHPRTGKQQRGDTAS